MYKLHILMVTYERQYSNHVQTMYMWNRPIPQWYSLWTMLTVT